jgi:hypothetical protein
MIDTIKIYCVDPYYLSQLDMTKIDSCTKHNGKYGEYDKGKINNLNVTISTYKITIEGSLTKFYLGNNVQCMTRNQIYEALDELETIIGINIDNFWISRLDISANFEMNYPVVFYLDCLIEKSRYTKSTYGEKSVLFSVKSKTISFYDKMLEFKRQKLVNLPSGLPISDNFLRYELQIKKVSRILKQKLAVKSLRKDDIIQKLLKMWINDFKGIKKKKVMIDIDSITIKKPKDFLNLLICDRIEEKGKTETLDMLSKLCMSNKLDRRRKCDLRRRIETNEMKFCKTSKYIEELENKIIAYADNFM